MNKKISICIPTYNRSKYILRLLNNISEEEIADVEVVIVNDGSEDDTDIKVNEFIKSNRRVSVKYFSQKNAGRAYALKEAILNSSGEYILIMDDEDLIKQGGIKIIKDSLDKLKGFSSNREIVGCVFLTEDISGCLIGKKFPEDGMVCNLVKINADFGNTGDKKQVIKSKYLKEVIYEVYPNERRMPTYILWCRIARKYDVVFFNKVISIKEYLNEGLSKNINKVKMNSPLGSMLIHYELTKLNNEVYHSKLYRIKSFSSYFRYRFHAKSRQVISGPIHYRLLGKIIGLSLYVLDRAKFG